MTRYTGADVGFFYVSGYELRGLTTKVDINVEGMVEDTTALGDTYAKILPVGLRQFNLSQDAFYDDAALATNAALVSTTTQIGISRIICIGLETNTSPTVTTGAHKGFIGFEGPFEGNYDRKVSRGALHKVTANYAGSGTVDQGDLLLANSVNPGATGNGLGADNGALTSNGGVGYFQVNSYTAGGASGLVMKIQHSATDGSYADLATFTTVTTAPIAVRVAVVAGTQVNIWVRCLWTFTGGSGSSSFTGMVGFARN